LDTPPPQDDAASQEDLSRLHVEGQGERE
jgi:hypothetical protein